MLELNLGLMKAGKSKELILDYHYAKRNGKQTIALTYKPDSHSRMEAIATRDKRIEPVIGYNLNAVSIEQLGEFDCLFIDEIQFSDLRNIDLLIELAKTKEIHCYGLYLDYLDKPFESTEYLVKKASEENIPVNFKGLKAFCDTQNCGNIARHNIRLNNAEQLFIVEKDIYKTVCTKCKKEIEG